MLWANNYQNQKSSSYLNKINDLIIYLFNFEDLKTINCFQIDVNNQDMLIGDLNAEFPLIISCDAFCAIYKRNLFKYLDFINILKQFLHISIQINYPSHLFDTNFQLASDIEYNFHEDQIKIIVYIAGIEKTDLK